MLTALPHHILYFTLNLPFHMVAVVVATTHDNVVIKWYANSIARALQLFSESIILNARAWIIARMIMCQDDTTRQLRDGMLENNLNIAHSSTGTT